MIFMEVGLVFFLHFLPQQGLYKVLWVSLCLWKCAWLCRKRHLLASAPDTAIFHYTCIHEFCQIRCSNKEQLLLWSTFLTSSFLSVVSRFLRVEP